MRPALFHALLAGTVCLVAVGVYGAEYAYIGAKSNAVANLGNRIKERNDAVNRIAAARASLAEIMGSETKIESYFVSETGVVAFINALEEEGRAQGTTVNVLSVAKSNQNTQSAFTIALTVKGTFNAVMRTVGTIEYAPYDLIVSTLAVRKDDKGSWRADMTIVVGALIAKSATSTPSL